MFWRRALPYLSLLVVVFAVYANVYQNQFLYDDEFLIQHNANLREWSGLWRSFLMSSTGGSGAIDNFYRPMQGFFYTLVFNLFGLSTFGFHLLNVLLHAGNALLVYTLGRRLGFSERSAWIAALLWCVHPVHTEAITYQSATADPLYTLFILLGLVLLVPAFTPGRIALAGVTFLLALFSKESAIVFPALAVACRFFTLSPRERWDWRRYRITIPLWVIAALYMIARKTVLNFDGTFQFYKTANIYTENWIVRFYTFLATLPSYLEVLFWPHDLHMDRVFPVFVNFWSEPVLVGAGIVLAAALVGGWEVLTARKFWLLAILWFAAAHVPHTGVFLPVNSFFLEHWMYLPTIGLFYIMGFGMAKRLPVAASLILACILAAILGTLTWQQNEVWATPITFYEHTLSYDAHVARVQNNLAMAYSDQGRDDEAIQHYLEAIHLEDSYPQTHHNLALAYVRKGRIREAEREFRRAIEMKPDFFQALLALSQLYESLGDMAHAREYRERYEKAVAKFR